MCHFEQRRQPKSREGYARCPAVAPEGKRQINLNRKSLALKRKLF